MTKPPSDAETLREAAALIRTYADSATPGPWAAVAGAFGNPSEGPDHMRVIQRPCRNAHHAVARAEYTSYGGADTEHIASWHPGVARAVANWLDATALEFDSLDFTHTEQRGGRRTAALAVARAYLEVTT